MMRNISQEKLQKAVSASVSLTTTLAALGKAQNGHTFASLRKAIAHYGISTSHFISRADQIRKHPKDEHRTCLFCKGSFLVKTSNRDQVCCSHSCSNRYKLRGNAALEIKHRTVCFKHFEHKCCVCDEKLIVHVHHMDRNHNNDSPENLVPLCPTHHAYMHSKLFSYMVEPAVLEYIRTRKIWPKGIA